MTFANKYYLLKQKLVWFMTQGESSCVCAWANQAVIDMNGAFSSVWL